MTTTPLASGPADPEPPGPPGPGIPHGSSISDSSLHTLSRVHEAASSIADRVRHALTPEGFRVVSVLVVDDYPDAADSLAAVLEMLGCPVMACYSGKAALTAITSGFDAQVCLIDLVMPRMDGFELAERLKANAAGRPLMLVATTALGDEKTIARTKEAGFHFHLTKPVDAATLINTLTELGKMLASLPDEGRTGAEKPSVG